MLSETSIGFRMLQGLLALSVGAVTWWVVFWLTAAPFCWNAEDACIPVFQGLIAVPVAIWVGRWLARWFRRSWMRRGDESARPRGTWVLVRWVVVGAWLGFVATWLAGLVILLAINALGITLSEEYLPSLFPVAGFTAGALAGAILMPRLMAEGSPLR